MDSGNKIECCFACSRFDILNNGEVMAIMLEQKVTVGTIACFAEGDPMTLIKSLMEDDDFDKMVKAAQKMITKDPSKVFSRAIHKGYGQLEAINFNMETEFKAKGELVQGYSTQIIARASDEIKYMDFIENLAIKTVEPVQFLEHLSSVDFALAFDRTMIINLKKETYMIVSFCNSGIVKEEYDLPYSGSGRDELMHRVTSCVLNESDTRCIVITDILGIGNEDEKNDLPHPKEWIELVKSHAVLEDKWLFIGILFPDEEPFNFMSGPKLQDMINKECKGDDAIKVLNFCEGPVTELRSL